MFFGIRHSPDVTFLVLALGLQCFLAYVCFGSNWRRSAPARLLLAASTASLVAALVVYLPHLGSIPPMTTVGVWLRGWGFAWALTISGASTVAALWAWPGGRSPADPPAQPVDRGRRLLLTSAARASVAAPLLLTATGTAIGRTSLTLREVDVAIPNLPPDLNGLRIAQLSDVHIGPFYTARDLARAVAMANEAKPHVTVLTGDLLSFEGDPLDDALRELARLKSDAGVFGCHGNHEIYAGAEEYVSRQGKRLGMTYLRRRSAPLSFGAAKLNLVGFDYQRWQNPYLVGAEKLTRPDAVNVLLSHNPDVFPVAASKGYALTLSGHTHGGQINFEILHRHWNISRVFTPYTKGLYREGDASIYVSAGLGTIGVPVRFGSPPEVAVVRLCAT